MPKVDLAALPTYDGPDTAQEVGGALGDYTGYAISTGMGLTQIDANVEVLAPGSSSSHRHWHSHVDEMVVVLSGALELVEESGPVPMGPGDIAVFPAGSPNGHCLRNASDAPASFLVAGTRHKEDRCTYADLGLVLQPDGTLRPAQDD
ncbi:MAG: cupin domain-containing protein [Pseudomonadota bacterium]